MTLPVVQDSNSSVLSIAEEASIGVLPVTPVWRATEVNTYSDMGGDPTLVTRKVIGTRKVQKGTITGISPKVGFNADFTQTNMARLLQGFMFADVREKATTIPTNGNAIVVTDAANADSSYSAAAGLSIFEAGGLVLASGFAIAANNGVKTLVTIADGKLTVAEPLTDEGSPPAAAALQTVGFQFASADAAMTFTGGVLALNSTAKDMTQFGLVPGEWFYLGGDGAALKFATAGLNGYCRVASITTHQIVIDKFTGTAAADAGTGKTIRLFFGSVLKDETVAVRRTYTQERQLGSDADGIQTEQVIGTVANELTINSPKKDKLNVDMAFVGLDAQQFPGTIGIAAGTRIPAPGEDAYNTSQNVFRLRLSLFDGTTVAPVGFGYVTTMTLKAMNNATLNEAVGKVGGFEINIGDFDVTGTVECYFTTVSSIQAVRNKSQCSLDMIVAAFNAGWIFDIPFVELAGGLAKVAKNAAITLPLNTSGVQSSFGHTLLFNRFIYLPALAMPTGSVQI